MGPLAGFRIIEMAGIGPAPFAATLLADMGAEVIRIDRREAADLGLPGREPKFDVLHRGRRSLAVDLKTEAGRAIVKRLAAKADGLIEGFRPGVMERLGLAPEELLKLNPKLVFGRMTGFGQEGPMAQPTPATTSTTSRSPACCTRSAARASAGAAAQSRGRLRRRRHVPGLRRGVRAAGGAEVGQGPGGGCRHGGRRGLSGGGHLRPLLAGHLGRRAGRQRHRWRRALVRRLQTKDGKWLSVGAIEKRFYAELVEKLGLAKAELPKQHDRKGWPELRRRFTEAIASKTRGGVGARSSRRAMPAWRPCWRFGGRGPPPQQGARHVRAARGVLQPGPAPRYSRTRCEMGAPGRGRGADSEAVLEGLGLRGRRDRRAEEGRSGGAA